MSWVTNNLRSSLDIWNGKMNEIWTIVTQSPQTFKEGKIWAVMSNINGALQAVGFALLVLFFTIGIARQFSNIAEVKKPEHALKLFIRFVLAKAVVSYGMELMMAIFNIVQGVISKIISTAGLSGANNTWLPQEIADAVDKCNWFDQIPLGAVAILGGLFIIVLSFIMILSVYGRFFKLYLYTAIAPLPLSSFASQQTEHIGRSFLKSFIGVCMEVAIIVLACIIFNVFASSAPGVNTGDDVITMVWKYLGELLFNMLVLVGTIKMSDRVVKEMMGL